MPRCIAHFASIPISQAYQTALLRQNRISCLRFDDSSRGFLLVGRAGARAGLTAGARAFPSSLRCVQHSAFTPGGTRSMRASDAA